MSTKNVALKVGCGQFFYGKNCLSMLAPSILRLGGKALIIGGPSSVERVLAAAEGSLKESGVSYRAIKHSEGCTRAWAEQYAQDAKAEGFTVIVGVGGGLCVDLGKAAAVVADLPIITVPTSIATCVASSMLCIMYNEQGQRDGEIILNREVEVCIADHDQIACAPRRLLAAGILDSMAKLPEVRQKLEACENPTALQLIQVCNSQAIYDYLLKHGLDAYAQGGGYPYFDELILTNLLHTSVVSGFAAGGGQLAIAHAVYDGLRTRFPQECKDYLHGELVAVGILIQMLYNGSSQKELAQVEQMMSEMKMPMRLSDMGFAKTAENVQWLYDLLINDTKITAPHRIAVLKAAVDYAL